jgi:hypothetical protein
MEDKIKKYELYGLYCPFSHELKYIGITKNGLSNRLNAHLRKPTNYLTKCWFNELKIKGYTPIIKLIKECDSYENLLKNEIEEIKRCRDTNIKLLNICDGGDINPMYGKTHSDDVRKKISDKKKGVKMSEEVKKIHKDRIKNLWSNPEWSEKVKLKMKLRVGEKNPNWKGGLSFVYCKCGKRINYYNTYCFNCLPRNGENNPFFGKKHNQKVIDFLKEQSRKFGKDNPNYKYDINEDELYDMYINQNKTIVEISSYFKCAINTINKKLRQYKIYKPKSNIYNLMVDDIKNYLESGLNYVQIGNIYGCNNKIIHKFVKKHNLYVK